METEFEGKLTGRVAFRVDASAQVGIGHVMRCLALADVLRAQGVEVHFVCRALAGHRMDLIREWGFSVLPLRAPGSGEMVTDPRTKHAGWLEVNWSIDCDETIAALQTVGPVDWLIVDSYALDKAWEQTVGKNVRHVLVIDDLADRAHACDVLLDQNFYHDPHVRYQDYLSRSSRLLAGPQYALLRQEFAALRATLGKRTNELKRVLVFMGGADPTNETAKVLEAFEHPALADLEVDIVIGASNPHRASIQERCAVRSKWRVHSHVREFHRLMSDADLAIGAAGSAAWERCVLGLPSIMLAVADNQRHIGEAVAAFGAGAYLGPSAGVSVADIVASVEACVRDPSRLGAMRQAGRKLVDGKGAQRVSLALFPRKLSIAVVSDKDSWLNEFLPALIESFRDDGHIVSWVHQVADIPAGDCAFYLSCGQLARPQVLARNVNNLVVHESPLPLGKGWAPLTWQILEGKNEIPVLLLEAAEAVDSGSIYLADQLRFTGYELCDDLRRAQARATLALCRRFVESYPWLLTDATAQRGASSYYPRRTPADSRLDPDKTLREQFPLLRVVDNDRYPAFFELAGHEYVVRIEHRQIPEGG